MINIFFNLSTHLTCLLPPSILYNIDLNPRRNSTTYFNVDVDNILTLVYPVAYMAREYDSNRTYTLELRLYDILKAKYAFVT
jgi:hypothetical protein